MHGMIAWFARNAVAANLLMVLILVLGAWSATKKIPLEIFPSFESDFISVVLSYRGATPKEVEEAVVIRVEESISDLMGIKKLYASAYEGVGRVTVEVDKGYEPREVLDDIKNRVDAIIGFPADVENPVYSLEENSREVISVALTGQLPELEMRKLGEQVRDDIAALPEVSLVQLSGVRDYEMTIEISESVLDQYNLTFDQIVTAVRRSSQDLPAGSIKTDAGEILLRTKGQAYNAIDFSQISIFNRNDGSQLKLGDIATIRDSFEEEVKFTLFNGEPALMIEVFRSSSQNAIEVASAVRDYVSTKGQYLPQGIEIAYWRDRSRIVKQRLQTLMKSAWQGGLLVFLCLALFLRLSVALWVCIGIPISFMGALALMPIMGTTLNMISLFAFILVLGIVVDDAIITGENIYSHLKRQKQNSLDASINGAQEVSIPVTFGLLTTLAAFSPLFMIEGYRGPIFAQLPLIVFPVLAFSWIESKLILPTHMSHIKIKPKEETGFFTRLQESIANGLENAIVVLYRPVLRLALHYRYLTFALFITTSIIILSFVISGRYGFNFFPSVQSETIRASLVMESGTSAATTAKHLEKMLETAEIIQKKYMDEDSGISVAKNIMTSFGWRGSSSFGGDARGNPEAGQVKMELLSPDDRPIQINTYDLVAEWREAIGPIPGASTLNFRAGLGHEKPQIAIQLTGADYDELQTVSAKLQARLAEYPGVSDIEDDFEKGKSEIELRIKPEAELLGISATDLGRQVRQAFFGAEAQRIQRGRDDVRVMIKYPEQERKSIGNLDTMRIRTSDEQEVPIGNVTEVVLSKGFSTIHRVNRNRALDVTAELDSSKTDLNKVTTDLSIFLNEILLDYPDVRYTFEGEQREQAEAFGSLAFGSIFVLFCIYALLAIPLRSYLQPFIVMLVIPFSLVGAILGHMLLGMNLSIMSVMGCLALAGVVVNDSLILVEWINRQRRKGVEVFEAVQAAGSARFRAILLTSLTTFAGLAPLIWEKSTQAQFLIPMAISLGFGILYATLLSLILVPSGYLILEDVKRLTKLIFNYLFNRSNDQLKNIL